MTEDPRSDPRASCDESAAIRVLIVDDDPFVRAALADRLSDEDDLFVVGMCGDGSEVVEAVARLSPDVVCMDVSMPLTNGLEATEAVRAAEIDVGIVMLTGGSTTRREAGAAGADALVRKSTSTDQLLGCLRTLAGGGRDCPCCL
jgi:DNA-binding NarL/FixJ family response regulator